MSHELLDDMSCDLEIIPEDLWLTDSQLKQEMVEKQLMLRSTSYRMLARSKTPPLIGKMKKIQEKREWVSILETTTYDYVQILRNQGHLVPAKS
jgi:hypothetical protein